MSYSKTGLEHGIERAKVNIKALREAIKKEEDTIAEYRNMIAAIEEADRKKAEAEANVNLEVVRDAE